MATTNGLSERAFQDQVIAMAILYGWKAYHVRPGRTSSGAWMTHIQGHAGFPDLVLTHRDRGTIFAELKTENGRLDEAQRDWLETLNAAGNEVYVWRPKDIHFITQRFLRRPDADA